MPAVRSFAFARRGILRVAHATSLLRPIIRLRALILSALRPLALATSRAAAFAVAGIIAGAGAETAMVGIAVVSTMRVTIAPLLVLTTRPAAATIAIMTAFVTRFVSSAFTGALAFTALARG